MPDTTLILACGALAREITALIEATGWDHLRLRCLPAILHNTPDQIVPAVAAALDAATEDRILVAYGDCGTGGALAQLCHDRGVQMLPGAHCYAFFEGVERFAARTEISAFYLTDFLARQFDAFVWEPLGLHQTPELRDVYFAHYDRLIYLAQTDDPVLTAKAQEAADRLGLRFERHHTGYGDLAQALAELGPTPAFQQSKDQL